MARMRNIMDVWIAESDQPTPVLVSIHGGAFQNGTKSVGEGLLGLAPEGKDLGGRHLVSAVQRCDRTGGLS